MIRLIVEIEGGVLRGVYSDAHQGQEFEVCILDHDLGKVDTECLEENKRLDAVLCGPGWRGID